MISLTQNLHNFIIVLLWVTCHVLLVFSRRNLMVEPHKTVLTNLRYERIIMRQASQQFLNPDERKVHVTMKAILLYYGFLSTSICLNPSRFSHGRVFCTTICNLPFKLIQETLLSSMYHLST
jgi:hypothetical protein